MSEIKILFQDQNIVAIHKPSGFHVHPQENSEYKIPKNKICLYVLRNELNKYLYPVHRLDAGTSGVLLFALNKDAAREISQLFQEQKVKKTYHAVIRGWLKEKQGLIEIPLESDSSDVLLPSETEYEVISERQTEELVGKRQWPGRYSLIKVNPKTGRYHQIRRHFNRISHPIIGDAQHGDSHHNRFFRETFGIEGLCLRASKIYFEPSWVSGQGLEISTESDEKWKKCFSFFEMQVGDLNE